MVTVTYSMALNFKKILLKGEIRILPKQAKLGVSVAASWAWGTSLIVGMEIAQQKGLKTWLIWAIANAATLAVFGALTRTGLLARHVFDGEA